MLLALGLYGGAALAVGKLCQLAAVEMQKKLAAVPGAGGGLVDSQALLKELVASQQFRDGVRPWLETLGGASLVQAVEGGALPWIALPILIVTAMVLPGLALLIGYDRISEDLHTRYARYVFQRVHRESYLAGKVLGQVAILFVPSVVVFGVLIALSPAVPGVQPAELVGLLVKVVPATALLILAHSAFTAAFSANLKPPFLVLAFGGIAQTALWIAAAGSRFDDVWIGTTKWGVRLLLGEPVAIAAFLAWTALFCGAAFLGLRWRDV